MQVDEIYFFAALVAPQEGCAAEHRRLHATVRSRMVKDRFVIDEEYIVGLPADDPHVSVIIYEVRDGLIRNVWFIED